MSTGSRRTTSEPPPASSWAAPPEFYVDVNLTGKTLRRFVEGLGYIVHTPAQLYGDRLIGEVISDEVWLRDVGPHRWVVLGRDTTILKPPHELAAYKAARVHMFLFPRNATRSELVATLSAVLNDICVHSSADKPGVWRVHGMPRPRIERM